MKSITLVLVCVLINLTDDTLSDSNITTRTKKTTEVLHKSNATQNRIKKIDTRSTDNPNYDPNKDQYVNRILTKHHENRRAKKLRKHKQKIKESIDAATRQQLRRRSKQKQQQPLRVFEHPAFLANMSRQRERQRESERRRRRKNKHTMFEPVRAANRARGNKVTWKNNASNSNYVIDLSKYKSKGLRVDKTDFNGRDYYSPYLAKFSIGEMFSNMF